MLDADKSHLDVTWVSQSLYSGPLSNPDFFLSLIAGRIRKVVLYYLTLFFKLSDYMSMIGRLNFKQLIKRMNVMQITNLQ